MPARLLVIMRGGGAKAARPAKGTGGTDAVTY